MEELEKLRDRINEWDQKLIEAFEGRLEVVSEILEYKRNNGLPIYDKNREEVVIQRALKNLKNSKIQLEAEVFLKNIIAISRKMQSKKLFPFNIVLIGFMGTGKTTVGNELAEKLDMEFVDLDEGIEDRLGMKISEFFKKRGEETFRKIEKSIVEEISKKSNTVISCGGGVVLDKENIDNLRRKGKLLLLKAREETIYKRLKEDKARPLLQNQRGVSHIRELLEKRKHLYLNSADYVFDTDDKTPELIVKEIIKELLS